MKGKKTQSLVVLMLDNEPLLIDRRIQLEAKSLVEAGYRVVLATQRHKKQGLLEHKDGFEIRRFPQTVYFDEDNVRRSIEKILAWRDGGAEETSADAIVYETIKPTDKMKEIFRTFRAPPRLAKKIEKKFPALRKLFGIYLEPIVFLGLLRIDYLKPYFHVAAYKINKKYNIEPGFEREVLNFSDKLKPDFVHAHDLPNLELGIKIADKHSVPLIYDAHELYPQQYFANKVMQSNLANKEKEIIGKADAVIAVNDQCRDILINHYSDIKHITVITNAANTPRAFSGKEIVRLWHQQFNLDASVKIMVFQGTINPVRNIDELVHSLPSLPEDIHLGFITFRKDIDYYKRLSEKLNVSHRVHYVLEVPWEEVFEWLIAADAGIMPYQPNNLNAKISSPNKLFEFVVAGLPIIGSSELVNVEKAINQYGLGVCHKLSDVDSYVRAINEMFNKEKGGSSRFKQNVLNVKHLFSWEQEELRLLELYSRLSN